MSDGFAEMIQTANDFFQKLKANNTRSFFEAHKAFYNAEIKKPAELLADLFAEDLARHTGKAHGPKLFRVHRDVRFSKDKTPYNARLHMNWTRPGPAVTSVWFFGASPDYVILGMGLPGMAKESLTRFRQLIDRDGDEVEALVQAAEHAVGVSLSSWGPDPLKRVPKPYDQDHPQAELLKRKSFILHASLPEDWEAKGALPTLNAMVPHFLPLWRKLDAAFPGAA